VEPAAAAAAAARLQAVAHLATSAAELVRLAQRLRVH